MASLVGWRPRGAALCLIARAGQAARRGCSRPSWRSGSATAADRPVGVHGWSPPRPALRTRRSGRCCIARPLTSTVGDQGSRQQLRVALPGRPAAHGHKPLRALPAARPPRYRRPLTVAARPQQGDTGRLRLCPRDRRRPLPARLRRAPRRREGRDRDRLRGTRPRLLRAHGIGASGR